MGVDEWRIPDYVIETASRLRDSGYEAYIVGGAVRDLVMGCIPSDFDMATDAAPDQIVPLFAKTVPTGLRYGTVTVICGDGNSIEVTSYRADGSYNDGRHPEEVRFGVTLVEDLSRRDFTINAMAFDPIEGRIVDPFGGSADIKAGVIRTVGEPAERFGEDKLRMVRAVRFASRFGFTIDTATRDAAVKMAEGLRQVSIERIREEFTKILLHEKPSKGVELLREIGLIKVMLPELLQGYDMSQNKYHAFTVYEHTLAALDSVPPTPELRWGALLHDIGKPKSKKGTHFYGHEELGAAMAKEILTRYRFPARFIGKVVHLIRHHLILYRPDWSDAAIRRFIQWVGKDNVPDMLALYKADTMAKSKELLITPRYTEFERRINEMLEKEFPLSLGELAINGNNVVRLLGGAGPEVGKAMEWLLARVTENPSLNSPETLYRLLQEEYYDNRRQSDLKRDPQRNKARSAKVKRKAGLSARSGRGHSGR